MSILAMAHPAPHSAFQREFSSWGENRQSEYPPMTRPRGETEKIALPSIRQAIPELQLRLVPSENQSRSTSATTSPIQGPTPPEYTNSPNQNKRRRVSIDGREECVRDERAHAAPRMYMSPPREMHRGVSPGLPRAATDSWVPSQRSSPYLTPTLPHALPAMRSSPRMEAVAPAPSSAERMSDLSGPRPSLQLPSIPHMTGYDRSPASMPSRVVSREEYHISEAPRPPMMSHPSGPPPPMEHGYRQGPPPPSYPHHHAAPYGYHHPARVHSLSLGSIHSFERTPFSSSGGYGAAGHYHDYMRMGEMSMGSDGKQRKRRGNLPKETTDKLRAWFLAHLHHPYPTEDEKQDLMKQTGLQMNQISNWFINARRRQLPTIMNNARAESDAMSMARGGSENVSKVLPSTERNCDYDDAAPVPSKRDSPLSDGFDDDMDSIKRRRVSNMKHRGSV